MDDVFGNSSGETVVESPRSIIDTDEQNLSDFDLRDDRPIYREDPLIQTTVACDNEHDRNQLNKTINCINDGEVAVNNEINPKLGLNNNRVTNKDALFSNKDALILVKNKIVELNNSRDMQIEQNTENHHLEEVQKSVETKLNNDDHVYISEKCFNDISKSKNCEELKLNSGVEKYLNEMSRLENLKKVPNKNCNIVQTEDYFNSLNAIRKQNYQSIPRYKAAARNTVYQLPPMRHTQPIDTGNLVSSPNLQKKIQPRPRANTASPLVTRHLYQNIPVPLTYRHSPIHRQAFTQSPKLTQSSLPIKTPTYVNVPAPKTLQTNSLNPQQSSMKHSYIQLWSGSKHESLSDTECSDIDQISKGKRTSLQSMGRSPQSRLSSPGYVPMTSPYVRSPVSTVFAQLSNSLATYAGHAPQTIFCPLCPRQFSYERILASHIQKTHRLELEAMIDGRPGDLSLQCCPICQARFFNSSVLPKHLIDCHKGSVVSLLEKHRCLVPNSNGMQCPFCVKSFPISINGEHLLMFHLQQYHLRQYEDMIYATFTTYNSHHPSMNGSPSIKDIFGFDPGATSTPGLSGKLISLSVMTSDSKRKLEDMEKEETTWSSHQGRLSAPASPKDTLGKTPKNYEKQEPRRSVSKGILRREKKSNDKPNVKRELRFSVPHVTKEAIYYPESPGPVTPDYRERIDLNAFTYPENNNNANRATIQQEDMDAITTEEFIDMNQQVSRKRRRLGIGIKSKKIFRCKDKENQEDKSDIPEQQIYTTINTRTFRRPKPVAPPKVPNSRNNGGGSPCAAKLHSTSVVTATNGSVGNKQQNTNNAPNNSSSSSRHNNKPVAADICEQTAEHNPSSLPSRTTTDPVYPFSSSLRLYSPLRLFRCNGCRHKFCDNDSLLLHINQHHRSLMSLLRPQFGCGVCAAKFYENKYLVKHCLQHHTSLLEIRSDSVEDVPVLGPSSPGYRRKSAPSNAGKQQVTSL